MSSSADIPDIQHYVPRLLLRRFAADTAATQIFAFDKHMGRAFGPTNIKNVAGERGFNDCRVENGLLTLEIGLSTFEAKSAAALDVLHTRGSLLALTEQERTTIAEFAAVQLVRVPMFRDLLGQAKSGIRGVMEKRHGKIVGDLSACEDPELQRLSELEEIRRASEFVPEFLSKDWMLFAVPPDRCFYISDNPIVLQNHGPTNWSGNLGLRCKGIEIYLPLSRSVVLAFYCPSHKVSWRVTEAKIQVLSGLGVEIPDTHPESRRALEGVLHGLKTGRPIPISEDVLDNLNGLQVARSKRFVYSSHDDFDLARRILSQDPTLRDGMRMEFS